MSYDELHAADTPVSENPLVGMQQTENEQLREALAGTIKALRKAMPYLPADSEAIYCGEWIDQAREALNRSI